MVFLGRRVKYGGPGSHFCFAPTKANNLKKVMYVQT